MIKKIQSKLIGKIKKIYFKMVFLISALVSNILFVNANGVPSGLIPSNTGLPGDTKVAGHIVSKVGGGLLSELIQYVAVIAVIALMASGVMYLISGGQEEKVKKAKTWVISSLVGVLLSISAWTIIRIINNININ